MFSSFSLARLLGAEYLELIVLDDARLGRRVTRLCTECFRSQSDAQWSLKAITTVLGVSPGVLGGGH